MLPLGDDNSGRRIVPFVTYALIAVNVTFFQAYSRNRHLLRVMREAAAVSWNDGFGRLWLRTRADFVDRTERARTAVRKAIKRAIDEIDAADPVIGQLLRSSISTGATCVYVPDPNAPVRWSL